ncbi:hypothetical protein NC653_041241 [Populus alba x Populus x berolinensis]|uniref:SREBP regulating gene protein n=1 Tax=Populus alba x Populus x berolinensis TaxID=444605 RepID=A0AAD6L817_9ROSI|nr:hypothetical protein NC653_041241 [Populus alba x Populus x berolinensis]
MTKYHFSLQLLILFQFSSIISAIRKDIGFEQIRSCRNTVQGRYLLSDDNGYVCDALSVDPQSRCCPENRLRFSWDATLFHSVATPMNFVFRAASILQGYFFFNACLFGLVGNGFSCFYLVMSRSVRYSADTRGTSSQGQDSQAFNCR